MRKFCEGGKGNREKKQEKDSRWDVEVTQRNPANYQVPTKVNLSDLKMWREVDLEYRTGHQDRM